MSYDGGDTAAQLAAIGGSIFTYRGTGISIKIDTFKNILTKGEGLLVIVTNADYFT
ncbi:MAG: hypothetical protein RLZZ184_2239 [Cyanobacteriota bacterium]|jgi:hypothetical protein